MGLFSDAFNRNTSFGGLFGMAADPANLFGPSATERELLDLAKSPFGGPQIQNFLPESLRSKNVNQLLQSGIQGIGNLIQNPGRLDPNVSDAIRPRLAGQSENLAQNFRGIRSQSAGTAARTNSPVSLKNSLAQALNVEEARGQRGLERNALSDSDQLRRQDLSQVFKIFEAMNAFVNSRFGGTAGILGQVAGSENDKKAAGIGAIGSLFSSASRLKENIEMVEPDDVLAKLSGMSVYEWSYIDDDTRHIGPMAEDFRAAFNLGDGPDTIHVVDAFGTMMAALKAMAKKIERLESGND